MSSNQEMIINKYSGGVEDNRANQSRSESMEFHYTKKLLQEYIKPESNVIESGCATGYYGMHFADNCKAYTGVDITPDNIAVFNKKIAAENKTNVTAKVGDAINLSEFLNESFDVVLCLGPMYHLPQEERLTVFSECCRIARPNAILAFAYVNGIGIYAGACVTDRNIYPNADANKYVFEYRTSDTTPGLFFFTSPEEMEHDAKQNNLNIVKNCGLDFWFIKDAIDAMSEEQFKCYWELSDKMVESQSCTGLSNHALLICRKGE